MSKENFAARRVEKREQYKNNENHDTYGDRFLALTCLTNGIIELEVRNVEPDISGENETFVRDYD